MKLLVIAYPLQAIIVKVFDEESDFNDSPINSWNCWYNEIEEILINIKNNFDIKDIYLYGESTYTEKIEENLSVIFNDIKIERI